MRYATIMLHMDLGRANAGPLATVQRLAERFDATIIGIAACEPLQIDYSGGHVPGDLIEQDSADLETAMQGTEAEFRSALKSHARPIEWRTRSTFGTAADFIAQQARAADLIVMTATSDASYGGSRRANTAEVIMQCGRPVLVVPATPGASRTDRVLVAWKDTRESRRAIVDARPLLGAAQSVCIAELTDADRLDDARVRVSDVARWLAWHGIEASTTTARRIGDDAAQLQTLARDQDADVIVAGAYGHSRLREWALGGVTRELLAQSARCVLLSH